MLGEIHVHVSMSKTRDGKASFCVMVTNLNKFFGALVQKEREEVGGEEQIISPTLCMCIFPLDRCAEYITHTQIVCITGLYITSSYVKHENGLEIMNNDDFITTDGVLYILQIPILSEKTGYLPSIIDSLN